MKKILLSSILLMQLIVSVCQTSSKAVSIDIEKEIVAIKAVIENESRYNSVRDFEKQQHSFLQDETLIGMGASKDICLTVSGWDNMKAFYKDFYKKYPEPVTNKLEFTNYQVKVFPESAWAFYHQNVLDDQGKILTKYLSGRFLEKVDGEWKIAFMTYADVTSYEEEAKK